jgi:AraC-like DNA-binding protein
LYLTLNMEGIAKEVGFNTAESFSKAFYKRTGMKPSFFINELKKKNLKK